MYPFPLLPSAVNMGVQFAGTVTDFEAPLNRGGRGRMEVGPGRHVAGYPARLEACAGCELYGPFSFTNLKPFSKSHLAYRHN